jgi:response regulator RpfG family c-di-GMP phosphodiesterase
MTRKRPRILAVDDEPGVLFALQDQLEEEFEVITTERAETALEILATDPSIAVLISDQRMPRMQGDELLAEARSRSDAVRILCSGYTDLPALVRAINDGGIFAFIQKPWDNQELRARLNAAVEQFETWRALRGRSAALTPPEIPD